MSTSTIVEPRKQAVMETKGILQQAREQMLTQLIELAAEGRRASEADKYRERARTLIQEISIAEKALQSIAPGSSQKYAHHKRAIEAILDFLDSTGRPATEAEIIKTLTEGGFRGGVAGTALVIQKSIRSYLHGTGAKTAAKNPELAIKMVGELIGRADWEKVRFRP